MGTAQRTNRPLAGRTPWVLAVALAFASAASAGGCGLVPKSKMDDCRRVAQTLRSDNNRLKDVAVDLRARNQELSQRAVDDATRISAQQEAVERLETSVMAYQAEREKLAAAFETIQRQVRLSAEVQPSAALGDRLRDFAGAREGWALNPASGSVSAPFDRLFKPRTAELTPEALADLKTLAAALKTLPADGAEVIEVAGLPSGDAPADPAVQRASVDGGKASPPPPDRPESASERFLAASRAAKVRSALMAESGGLDGRRVRLIPARAGAVGSGPGRVEVRAGGLDSGKPPDK